MSHRSILVLGATGGLGGAIAARFLAAGWQVQALARHIPKDKSLTGIRWIRGDAMNAKDVLGAAVDEKGSPVALIFHGLNPPRYQHWRALALPMLANAIHAAKQTGARILFPGNVYNYAKEASSPVDESAPQQATTQKGLVRVEMESMLKQACDEGMRALIVRAGDFFGRAGPSTWFSTVMIQPNQPVKSVRLLTAPDVGHCWAYLPDLADAFFQLSEKEDQLQPFDAFHFQGHWMSSDREWVSALERVTGRQHIRVHRIPWRLIASLSPWIGLMREINEMKYLWQIPLALDNRKLLKVLGTEPHTPLDAALKQALIDQGCLD